MNYLDNNSEIVVIAYPQDWHWVLSIEYQFYQKKRGIHVDILDLSYVGEHGFRSLIRKTLGGNYLRKISRKQKIFSIVNIKFSFSLTASAVLRTIQDYKKLPHIIQADDCREIYNSCVEKSGNLILNKSKNRFLVLRELYAYNLMINSLNNIKKLKYSCAVTVNGRFTKNATVQTWAENQGISRKLIEFGAGKEKFEVYDVSPHSMEEVESKISRYWETSDSSLRMSVAKRFLTKLAKNAPITDIDWRNRMRVGYLPTFNKPRLCTFFASTESEYAGVGDSIPSDNFSNQVEAFQAIVDFLPAHEWQIVLRRHPKNPQSESTDPEAFLWDQFRGFNHVLIVEPESPIDSIALGLNSDLVTNFCSIIAMELIARGSKNVYTLGPSPWRKLLPALQVENSKRLKEILEDNVTMANPDSILPWCYYVASHGNEFQITYFDVVAQRWRYRTN